MDGHTEEAKTISLRLCRGITNNPCSTLDFGIYCIYISRSAQMFLINVHVDVSCEATCRCLFDLSLHLHPYVVYVSSKDFTAC